MVPKTHRLPSYVIRSVMRTGKRIYSPVLQASFVRVPDPQTWRIAIVVPKSVDARATARNRIKRLISESLKEQESMLKNFDIVFTVKRGFSPRSQVEASQLVKETLQKVV